MKFILFILPLVCFFNMNTNLHANSIVQDPHSYASTSHGIIQHAHLNLTVSFEQKKLSGSVLLDIQYPNPNETTKIVLDTRDLIIHSITDSKNSPLKFSLGKADPILGSSLLIDSKGATQILISYTTSPTAPALQWLNPSQTAGKKLPFLFTQSQAILARSWVPIQDSPGIRFTYSADIQCPSNLIALMSAENPTKKSTNGKYHFEMPQAIPAYLLALVVADFEFKDLGNSTGVYAEPATIQLAASELSDLPKMVEKASSIYGNYAWGRYDVAFMPPSFPFGGMENPRITFATPTILAGDKSLVSLIAHELAHSWSGNLVTNSTWNDFWLNEGFTVYFELRIMEAIYGTETAESLRFLSVQELQETISEYMQNGQANDTHLYLELSGRDPDEGVSAIAYDKGALFLWNIENLVGREKFDAFVNQYFKTHAFKGMITSTFIEILETQLLQKENITVQKFNPRDWIYASGIPKNAILPSSPAFVNVQKAYEDFVLNSEKLAKENSKNTYTSKWKQTFAVQKWSIPQWLHFINLVGLKPNSRILNELDSEFKFSTSGNAELQFAFLMASISADYTSTKGEIIKFVSKIGRRKFVLPIYKALNQQNSKDFNSEFAKQLFLQNRASYHYVTESSIAKLLNL